MSYSTEVEGDTYFALKLNASTWDDATSGDKVKALSEATLIIDKLDFSGAVTTEGQANEFPRDEATVVPDAIKNANNEIAYALLDGIDPNIEYENLKMISQGYANVRSTYDRRDAQPHVLAGIPSVVAWQFLMPYLNDPREIILQRV